MGNKNEVTIYDIAKALNLSTSTISRALNGSGFVHDQTRSKVAKAANELGYRRNILASRLRSQKSQLLGAMVTHLNTPIASCVVSGAEAVATQLGYSLLINQSMNKPELRINSLENLRNQRVDGILVTSAYYQEHESLDQLATLNRPMVVVEASSLLPSRPKKKVSDFENAYELTTYLVERGCKRIAYLSVDINRSRHAGLLRGYQEALQDHNLPDGDKLIMNSPDIHDSWSEVCEIMVSMTTRPDGIIFSNNKLTALAFTSPDNSGPTDQFWLTCRKGNASSYHEILLELGKLAATLLICLNEKKKSSLNIE